MKHTKIPWRFNEEYSHIENSNREIVAEISFTKPNDMKTIINAVNNIDRITKQRDNLLEAAKYMIEKLENGSLSERNDALLDLEQAIQSAEASDD
jgi:hypothetical protein